jgi:type IV secretory pathway VirB6-like protein
MLMHIPDAMVSHILLLKGASSWAFTRHWKDVEDVVNVVVLEEKTNELGKLSRKWEPILYSDRSTLDLMPA